MPAAPMIISGLRPTRSTIQMATHGEDEVDRADEHGLQQRDVAFRCRPRT